MFKVCIDSVGPFPVDLEGFTYVINICEAIWMAYLAGAQRLEIGALSFPT
jgi:hypothetical protein